MKRMDNNIEVATNMLTSKLTFYLEQVQNTFVFVNSHNIVYFKKK